MIGCVLATVGVIGLLKMAHYRRHAYGYGCGGWGHRRWRHHHLHHGRHRGAGFGHEHGGGWDDGGDASPEGDDGPGLFAGRGRWGRRFILNGILDRLEATPAQERVVTAAVDEFQAEAAKFRGELRKSRGDIAGAFRKPQFDEVAMGELYARHDVAIEGLRRAFVGLGAKVHDALDEKQRAQLAHFIEVGPGGWGGGFFRAPWRRGGFDRHTWD
jgi:hypothetical protein